MLAFLKKLKDNLVAIGGVVLVILFGWLYIKKSGQDADAALKQNEEDKKKLADLDKKIDNNNQQLVEEEKKRQDINKNLDEVKKDVSKDDLTKYFNDPNNKPS